jgi:hypothetical protein
MRHRYYISSTLIQGRPQTAGSVARVPAVKIEAAIVGAVRAHIGPDARDGFLDLGPLSQVLVGASRRRLDDVEHFLPEGL